ncbi:MAG: glycosyltransferase family 39 protein [Chitinophagales bacterium]
MLPFTMRTIETLWTKNIEKYYFALGFVLLIYLILRAVLIPMTIDEVGTTLNYVPLSVWDIMRYTDAVPNNHILNTLLIKCCTQIFGVHSFTVRLPNILAFILCYYMLIKWLRALRVPPLFVFCGIAIVFGDHYFFEFFALARGYALSVSLMITAIYYSWRYARAHRNRHIWKSYLFAAFAVYANFTILNMYAAFVPLSILAIILLQKNHVRRMLQHIGIVLFVSALLALLSFGPISKMVATDQFRFWDAHGFIPDTLMPVLRVSASGLLNKKVYTPFWSEIYVALVCISGIFCAPGDNCTREKTQGILFLFFFCSWVYLESVSILFCRHPFSMLRTRPCFSSHFFSLFSFFLCWR